uniref:Uncharacterized protein n=1 Tax=Manihot esculenta TaxID=3983 RepID=A0A2C9V9D6_MANES
MSFLSRKAKTNNLIQLQKENTLWDLSAHHQKHVFDQRTQAKRITSENLIGKKKSLVSVN